MKFYLRTISYFKGDYGRIIFSMLLVAASTLLGLAWTLPLAVLTDTVLLGKHSENFFYKLFYRVMPDDTSGKVSQIIFLAVATLAIRLLAVGLTTVQTFINIRIGYNGQMRVRCDLFQKLQALSLAYHKSQPQGDAIHRLSYDTNGFQAVLNVLIGILVNILTLIGMVWMMATFHLRLTLISLLVIPPLVLTIRLYGRVLKKRYEQAYAVDTELTTAIQRSVSTIGVVQAFGREADEFRQFHETVGNTIRTRMRLHWDEIMYWLILGAIFAIGAAAIFGYGGVAVYRGELEVGALFLFLGFVDKLYDPLNKLSSSGASLAGGVAQVQRVFDVLDRDPVIKDSSEAKHLPVKARTLSLDHVVFEYRKGTPVLDDISCEIRPGQMVAFVGSSGVGKTTLLNLLPRFYDPASGAMRLDGIDVRGVKIADLRKHIALVLQESVILPTSVAENIAYGRPDATDAQIKAAAEQAGASVFIEKLDNQYEEQISESGQNLSGGQKQRISIARALVTESPIVVMDEPTSALDPQHEALIVETLKRLKGTRTIILVSHRLSTVSDCDQIFVMDAGKIVERGRHDELVKQRGLYFQMAKHQMKIEDTPAAVGK